MPGPSDQPDGYRLALYNFGIHIHPYEDPGTAGFRLREPLNFEAAARAEGFIGRSGYAGEEGTESWGEQVFPRFLVGSGHSSGPSSLSLWQDIETLMAFSYSGVHAEALKGARRWNLPQTWPPLVLWWVPVTSRPDWAEGVDRLEQLTDRGPHPSHFTFKQPFGPDGRPYEIDRVRMKAVAARNSASQRDLEERLRALLI